MKKIKKFKIHLRSRDILRILKQTTAITETTPQLEETALRESRRVEHLIAPAAVYETQAKEKTVADLVHTPPERWVAVSAYLVTIGAGMEEALRAAQQAPDTALEPVLHAIALEALEQSHAFARRLISAEAQEENCELSHDYIPGDQPAWEKFFGILPAEKIGVHLTGQGAFQPRYSAAGVAYWTPRKKKGQRSRA
jgi:cobalamin-dependent methionine synthase I